MNAHQRELSKRLPTAWLGTAWACCALMVPFLAWTEAGASVMATGSLTVSGESLILLDKDHEVIDADGSAWSNATLRWSVEHHAGAYQYTYIFNTAANGDQALSHITVGVSASFTRNDVHSWRAEFDVEGDNFEIPESGDPTSPPGKSDDALGEDGTPGKHLFGIKFNVAEGDEEPDLTAGLTATGEYMVTLTTSRIPVWNDVFLKSGRVAAVNSGYFDPDPVGMVGAGEYLNHRWIATPDTRTDSPSVVPEPDTAILAGLGLCSLLGWRSVARRHRRRRPGSSLVRYLPFPAKASHPRRSKP